MTTHAPEIEPDRAAMLRHVELVFGGGFDGALDGLVELAWTDAVTGSLRNAQLFGTDQLEELVDRAAELNRIERCNVYVGAALRKPRQLSARPIPISIPRRSLGPISILIASMPRSE